MADDTDFAALYRELGIAPDCTLDQFRRAYRRRVARLHPDQRGQERDVARLQQLNRLYDIAIDFHKTHGRLPGTAWPAARHGPVAFVAPSDQSTSGTGHEPQAVEGASGSQRYSRYFIVVALIAIAVLAFRALESTDAPRVADASQAENTRTKTAVPGKLAHRISLGMKADEVRAIQGLPIGSHEVRWDYGPSWIDFQCGKVADWYSSPLRPLHVESPRPSEQDRQVPVKKSVGDC